MSERCPACGASVPEAADWCSLCFADLRVPAVVSAAAEPPAAAGAVAGLDPLTAPLPALLAEARAAAEPAGDGGSDPVRPVVATWPCAGCGADVPLSDDVCENCGTSFLGSSGIKLPVHLPVVGDITAMTQNQRFILGAVLAVGLTIALLGIAFIGGQLF